MSAGAAAGTGPDPDLTRGELDVVELTGLWARGHHGVLPEETALGQQFGVDLRMSLDTRPAAAADALDRTVNYAAVADAVVEEIGSGPYLLIETLADHVARRVLADQVLVRDLELTLHKPSAPIPHPFDDVRLTIRRSALAVDAVLALGTNLGDRPGHLRRALALLHRAQDVTVTWTAPVMETEPVGGVAQDPFLNTVVGIRTTRGPWELLELAHVIEQDAHRVRDVRWGPRTLDVDVIGYGDLVQDDVELTLPHPRAHERAFVLGPWHAARPEARLAGHGAVAELLAVAPDRDGLRPGPDVDGFGSVGP